MFDTVVMINVQIDQFSNQLIIQFCYLIIIRNYIEGGTFFPAAHFSAWQTCLHFSSLFILLIKVITTQEKGGQTWLITFKRQIESVGSHQALISRIADGVQRRSSCIRLHRWRGCVFRQREARLQTERRCERRPRQVRFAFRNNEILGGRGDSDR